MISSKKGLLGSEFVLWFFRFLVVIFIIAAIAFMVYAVKKINYDVRDTETVLISNKIIECLTNDGVIIARSIDNFQNCININRDDIYVVISVFNSTKELKKADFGRKELNVYCEMLDNVKQKYPPACLMQTYLINFDDGFMQTAYLNMSIAMGSE